MHPIASCCKLLRLYAQQGVEFINEHMATAAASMANVTFVDCNSGFMARGRINSKLMPDALHPNPAGANTNAYCSKTLLSLPCERALLCKRILAYSRSLLLMCCRPGCAGKVLQGRAVGSGAAQADKAVPCAVETVMSMVMLWMCNRQLGRSSGSSGSL
jgi:hypothetical protein